MNSLSPQESIGQDVNCHWKDETEVKLHRDVRLLMFIAIIVPLLLCVFATPMLNNRPAIIPRTLTPSFVAHSLVHDVSSPIAGANASFTNANAFQSGLISQTLVTHESSQILAFGRHPVKQASFVGDVGHGSESMNIVQTKQGNKPPPELIASFDGLGAGFIGPQGTATFRNPSDNSIAVGPNHIVQIVNSRMAVFTKKGALFDTTGRVLYGPVPTNNVFTGFGDADTINNGDAVVRYDQLADRWLIVMPIFRRLPSRKIDADTPRSGQPSRISERGVEGQPGAAQLLVQPPRPTPAEDSAAKANYEKRLAQFRLEGRSRAPHAESGSYAMCYAVSTSPDPLGSYYRYEFVRPLFPDYPRPAVWPDGYYVPTSTGDDVIQKQAFVVDRAKMLKGEDATEQGVIIDGVNFLNNADLDGKQLPPAGAPNIMLAAGGTQLKNNVEDDGIYYWNYRVNWNDPSKTSVDGPLKIPVAPYHYLGDGQLSKCVTQPGTDMRLDSQGDKLMSRVVYRRIGDRESIIAVHSVRTDSGGGVRWYEFRLDGDQNLLLYQQGTYAPEGQYRWMGSPAMDRYGNIGIGYSFGGTPSYPGQRFTGRRDGDPLGVMTLHEAVLAEGEASQTTTLRWEDYAQTAIDPVNDRTIWYVGDYLRKGEENYSTRIGGFVLPAPGNAK